MINVCYQCGEYRADKIIELDGPYAICPICGYKLAFNRLPLLVVSGASGTGKTPVLHHLVGLIREAVLLDSDILWGPEFNRPEDGYRNFFESWLRIAMNIGLSGRPAVIFGAGMGVPANLESRVERRYFSTIHYLALVCDDAEIEDRLKKRPKWRGANVDFIAGQIDFNRWFKEVGSKGEPPVELLDTTRVPVEKTASVVKRWILENLKDPSTRSKG